VALISVSQWPRSSTERPGAVASIKPAGARGDRFDRRGGVARTCYFSGNAAMRLDKRIEAKARYCSRNRCPRRPLTTDVHNSDRNRRSRLGNGKGSAVCGLERRNGFSRSARRHIAPNRVTQTKVTKRSPFKENRRLEQKSANGPPPLACANHRREWANLKSSRSLHRRPARCNEYCEANKQRTATESFNRR